MRVHNTSLSQTPSPSRDVLRDLIERTLAPGYIGQFGQRVQVGSFVGLSADWFRGHVFCARTGWQRLYTTRDTAEFGVFFHTTGRMIALVCRGRVELEFYSNARSFGYGLNNLREYYARSPDIH